MAKQYATKQPVDHWRNQRGNQKLPRGKWRWKHTDPKSKGCIKSSSKREVYSNTILAQETSTNKQPKLTPNASRERETKKPKVSRRKEIIKIRAEINEIEMKKTIAKINETKSWFSEKTNKIDKPWARNIKKKRERIQINKIIKEEEEVTVDTTEVQKIITDY